MEKDMRAEITGHTKLVGLLGSPVAHSRSPQMQNEAFRQMGLDYVYAAFDVEPERLPEAVEGLRALGVRGWNVTMPHKKEICKWLDRLSPVAEICGSVNTVVNEDGVLVGHTTDGIGFLRAIQAEGVDVSGKKMVLLGSGGAATAILVQAALDGVKEIHVFSRSGVSVEKLLQVIERVRRVSACQIQCHAYSEKAVLRQAIRESAVVVQATSVGMGAECTRSILEEEEDFWKETFFYDVIYEPEETVFLQKAKAAGCRTANGIGMLFYQGAEAFRLWTGMEMPQDVIRRMSVCGGSQQN